MKNMSTKKIIIIAALIEALVLISTVVYVIFYK
jgi:F0F1-type ATP synthase membrane subunit c/vacuolar-type H+-ATPase subunit K